MLPSQVALYLKSFDFTRGCCFVYFCFSLNERNFIVLSIDRSSILCVKKKKKKDITL